MAEQRQRPPWIVVLIYMGLAGVILYASLGTPQPSAKRVSYSEFLTAIQDGKVETVRVTNSEFIGAMKSADKSAAPVTITTPRLPSMDESRLIEELRERHIQIIAEPQTTNW